jgi:hypothetical protein
MQTVLFTEDECKYILSGLETSPGTSEVDIHDRKYKEWLIKDREILDFILKRISNLSVKGIKEGRILIYSEGGFFDQHIDTWWKYPHRLKTVCIQLSNGDDYEGGVMTVGGEVFDRTIGNTVIFDGTTFHGMELITRGTRYVFVIWLDREDMGIVKSAL